MTRARWAKLIRDGILQEGEGEARRERLCNDRSEVKEMNMDYTANIPRKCK